MTRTFFQGTRTIGDQEDWKRFSSSPYWNSEQHDGRGNSGEELVEISSGMGSVNPSFDTLHKYYLYEN
jgi:hypothetical protein